MPAALSTSARPMPERSSSSGVSTAPAQTITSLRAVTSLTFRLLSRTLTPVTRRPSKSRRPTRARVATVRLRRPARRPSASAGRTKAS